MKQSVLRFAAQLWAMLAVLLLFVAAALPAHADDGDMDEITHYTVTVDTRADGSADITYELDWNVIGGSLDEPLTWVRIGLPNSHNDSLVNLTPDTVLNVSSVDDGGSFAKVDFINAYFPPDIAATIGAQSSVHFAFQVHQSHLFLLNEDGNADYSFTPGWFDDLCVDELTIRWVALDGIQADNDSQDGNYLVWNFGPLDHGESATVHVSVPAHTAQNYSPDAAATDSEMYYDDSDQVLVFFFVLLLVIIVIALITVSVPAQTGSGTVVLARMTPTTGTGIPTGTPISMLPVICPRQKATIAFPHPQTSRPGAERPVAVVPGGAAAVRITPTIPAARVRVPVFPAVHAPARVRAAAAPGAVPKTFIKLP